MIFNGSKRKTIASRFYAFIHSFDGHLNYSLSPTTIHWQGQHEMQEEKQKKKTSRRSNSFDFLNLILKWPFVLQIGLRFDNANSLIARWVANVFVYPKCERKTFQLGKCDAKVRKRDRTNTRQEKSESRRAIWKFFYLLNETTKKKSGNKNVQFQRNITGSCFKWYLTR